MLLAFLRALLLSNRRPLTANGFKRPVTRPQLETLEDRWVPATLTVDDNLVHGTFSTIGEAVAKAKAGDTIRVYEGTYTEAIDLTKKNLKLVAADGDGNPATRAIIKAPASLTNDAIIDVLADKIEIKGFIIDGDGNQTETIDSAIRVKKGASARIRNNTILNLFNAAIPNSDPNENVGYGVRVNGEADIEGNVIEGYHKGGVIVDGGHAEADLRFNTITGAGATDVVEQYGIQISRDASTRVQQNTIRSNLFDGSTRASGILVFCVWGKDSILHNNTLDGNQTGVALEQTRGHRVSNNEITDSSGDGLLLLDAHNNTIRNNILHNNGFDVPAGSGLGGGIALFDSSGNEIRNNSISESELDGIYLDNSDANVVRNNRITDSGANGIYVIDSVFNSLWNTEIRNSGENGILIEGGENNHIDNTLSVANALGGVQLLDTVGTTVERSQLLHNGQNGLALINADGTFAYNNTFSGNAADPIFIDADTTGQEIYNNSGTV